MNTKKISSMNLFKKSRLKSEKKQEHVLKSSGHLQQASAY